ncbi:helix-turn-helix domain-containing protein [Methylomicrobium sp. Wu6]|uniref:helix-turn-helix domain-containing protein n=1 Tax=Methylomicrobium sp. Wu6 TaxID=3107928 RepID=UPI002DD651FF|nr:helix-turn-helix domain-containing protein [Methylomicrobium sp. Wu6]MEC4748866.1 helix-turn-helix domain-containing protein [Methylomicrobium sp. Wu6]
MQPSSQRNSCQECPVFGLCLPYGLQKHEVSKLSAIVKNRRPLHIDEFLYVQGDSCQSLYAVKSGSFRSFIGNSEGDEQTIGFYLPGEFMGLDSLQYGRFTCTLIALETCSVCELPLPRLNELCSEIPGLQFQMMRTLGKEIASDHAKILALGHRSAKCRIAGFLLTLSRRYGALGFSGTEFNLSMRRYDIANFLGLTIETVSRQLADLNKCGIITVKQRGVQINDLDLLKSLAEPNPLALAG